VRFALSSGSLYTYGMDRVFSLAAEAGFDGIEVLIDPRFDTRQPDYLQRLIGRHGLPVLSVHAPFHPTRLHVWPQTYPRSIAAAAEVARGLGADVVVAHLPYWRKGEYARWLCQDLHAWQSAHPSPLIALENMPLKWFRWWPFAPLDPWRLNRLGEWGGFPYLTLDTTHLATKGLDPVAVYTQLRERVVHVHISNARRRGRRVQEHRRLEDGFLALDAFLGHLVGDGYAGTVTLELTPQSLHAEDEGRVRAHLRQQIDFLREYEESGGTSCP